MLCVNVGCTQSDDVTLVICIVCKCAAIVSSAVLLIVNTKYVRGLGTVAAVTRRYCVCGLLLFERYALRFYLGWLTNTTSLLSLCLRHPSPKQIGMLSFEWEGLDTCFITSLEYILTKGNSGQPHYFTKIFFVRY